MSKPGCCIDKEHGSPRGCNESTCMVLPDGKTCADCSHARRCTMIFGVNLTDTTCDFFPRRFSLKVVAGV